MKTKKDAIAACGTLGTPSKMPGKSYGLPAANCHTGQRLARAGINGPCSDCYAVRGNYQYANVAASQARRLALLQHPDWTRAMVWQLKNAGDKYFRWHDSGDIQSLEHFAHIIAVCKATPNVRHWLPTQEWALVRTWRRAHGKLPKNLVIRFSARKYGDMPRPRVWRQWSSVVDNNTWRILRKLGRVARRKVLACPAPNQNNNCGKCRACWDGRINWVVYRKH